MGGGRQLVEVGREMSPIGGLVRDQLLPTVAGVSVAGCNVGMDDGCNDVGATDVGGNVTDGSGGIVGIKEAAGCGTAVDDSSDTCVTAVGTAESGGCVSGSSSMGMSVGGVVSLVGMGVYGVVGLVGSIDDDSAVVGASEGYGVKLGRPVSTVVGRDVRVVGATVGYGV